jgi:hypothetical protein
MPLMWDTNRERGETHSRKKTAENEETLESWIDSEEESPN